MIKLQLDSKTWNRAHVKNEMSCLLDDNGNMCCLGFLCKKLGASDEELLNEGFPYYTDGSGCISDIVKKKLGKYTVLKEIQTEIAQINDNRLLSETARLNKLERQFNMFGYTLELVMEDGTIILPEVNKE